MYLKVLSIIIIEDVTKFLTVFFVFVLAFGGGLYFALRGESCTLQQYDSDYNESINYSSSVNTSLCLHPDETRFHNINVRPCKQVSFSSPCVREKLRV